MNQVPNEPAASLRDLEQDACVPLLGQGCALLGIELSARQQAQFELYYRLLVAWNSKFNLTAITEYEEVQVKHFLDCLAGLPVLAEALGTALPLPSALHLIDVGTGAGFPGIPLKIAAPRLKLTLMDGTGKKIRFLTQLVQALDLSGVQLLQGRAEELGRQPAHRGQYDVVTARAVAPMNTLVEYLLPLLRRNGLAIVYKGSSAAQEFAESRRAVELLGGETLRFAPVQVPFLDAARFVILIKKVGRTPATFPRGQGLARRQPLN